jgi:hypothetical protein
MGLERVVTACRAKASHTADRLVQVLYFRDFRRVNAFNDQLSYTVPLFNWVA